MPKVASLPVKEPYSPIRISFDDEVFALAFSAPCSLLRVQPNVMRNEAAIPTRAPERRVAKREEREAVCVRSVFISPNIRV